MDESCKMFFTQAMLAKNEKPYPVSFSQLSQVLSPEVINTMTLIGEKLAPINIVEAITPINGAVAKREWLKVAPTEFSNPTFCYDETLLRQLTDLEPKINTADELCRPFLTDCSSRDWSVTNAVMEVVHRRILEAHESINIARGILEGDNLATSESIAKVYGLPDTSVTTSAHQYARELISGNAIVSQQALISQKEVERLLELKFDASQIKQAFFWMAEQCGFANTRPIEINDCAVAIDVRDKSSQGAVTVIPSALTFTGLRLLMLTAHEVLCHWRDSENAGLLAKNLKTADEILYEGHAMRVQRDVELMFYGETQRLALPWRIIGMDLAKNGANFAQVAHELYPMILAYEKDQSKALNETWKACMRIFRGSTNTEDNHSGYVYTKDRAYFEGIALVNSLHGANIGEMAEFGVLSTTDLTMLSTVMNMDAQNFPYQYPQTLIMQMYEKIMNGGRFES